MEEQEKKRIGQIVVKRKMSDQTSKRRKPNKPAYKKIY